MMAQQVGGVGAVIFHDLKNYRLNDIEFSLEDMLRFEGETDPYVMHEHHLLRKGNYQESNGEIDIVDGKLGPL